MRPKTLKLNKIELARAKRQEKQSIRRSSAGLRSSTQPANADSGVADAVMTDKGLKGAAVKMHRHTSVSSCQMTGNELWQTHSWSKPCKRGIEKDVFNLVRSIAYTRELPASTANRHRAGWRKTGSSHQDWVGSKDVHSRDEYSASTGSHGPYNEARKRNKRHTDYKWELKLSLFTDNVVACHPGIHKKPNWGNEISKIQSQRQKS